MKQKYEQLLGENLQTDPTDRLCQRVMQKIEHRELSQIRRRSFGFGLILISAIIAFIPAVNYVLHGFSNSGLGQYVSLLSSDSTYVLAHWQELALSITDALPLTGIMAIVALLLVGLTSLRWFMRYQASLKIHQGHLTAQTI